MKSLTLFKVNNWSMNWNRDFRIIDTILFDFKHFFVQFAVEFVAAKSIKKFLLHISIHLISVHWIVHWMYL